MESLHIRQFTLDDQENVIALWEACRLNHPGNDPALMIRRKMAYQPELFLVGEIAAELVATVMAGYEGRRGWINLLAVHARHRRKSLGRSMMAAAETELASLGCPKINLQIRTWNTQAVAFYERLGYGIDPCFSMSKRLPTESPTLEGTHEMR